MKMISRTFLTAAAASTALAVWTAPSVAPAAEYFKGKSITVIVGRGAGGGTDTVARIYASNLGKYIPGNPTVTVRNMPGGGGAKSMNFVYEKARPDGRTIVYANIAFSQEVFGEKGVRFKYGKFTWIGPVLGPPLMMFARTDLIPGGLKKPTDIMKVKKLILPGQRPTGGLDMHARPTLDLLGLKYTYVPGYRGASQIRPAVRRGEVHLAAHGMTGWRSGVKPSMGRDGTVIPLFYWPQKDAAGNFVRDKGITEMPSFLDFYKEVFNKPPSGKYWDALNLALTLRANVTNAFLAPPNTNPEATAALRKGFKGMITDKNTIAMQVKAFGTSQKEVSLKTIDRLLKSLADVDPKLVSFWKEYNAEGAKAKKAPKRKGKKG